MQQTQASTKCCVFEQDTLSTLVSTGFYPGSPARNTQLRVSQYGEIDTIKL